jgi:flagellin-like hook-associated protein FlgL
MEPEMSDITLTASARSALTSLQGTASLMSRTQGRLTSGLKVASAIDDAVSFFKAQGLTDRASDFTSRKSQIDQGISSVTAAVNGTTIAGSIRTADSSTRATLTSQFNNLAQQLNSAEGDASYQGLNLVNNSTASLTVYFNQGTGASLTINAQNLNTSVLLSLASAASSGALKTMLSGGTAATDASGFSVLSDSSSAAAVLNNLQGQVSSAQSTVRAASARLGGNVTFLQTRLDFTSNYVNTMTTGSGKMTLADLNTEGANLVSLQTRQQIGIQSLSIAGQQQQAILSLLR